MRMFFVVVGVLSWVSALAVMWIFAEHGGALTVIASGIFAVVAMVALGCERIIKTLEEIRDRNLPLVPSAAPTGAVRTRVNDVPRESVDALPA